jgi:hypothetical protein
MENCYYQIEIEGRILLSNMPKDLIAIAASSPIGQEVSICPVRNIKKRWKKEAIEGGTVYLCSYDRNITRKIFEHYYNALLMMQSSFSVRLQEMVQVNTTSLRRLQHNVNTYNAKIQDDLEELIALEDVNEKDWKKILDRVEKIVANNTKRVAITFLKIAKNAALVNAEMDVYDYLQNSKGMLEIHSHPIHKVVKLSLQPFFLDFLEKGITIEFGTCINSVMIDFSSISVVFGHFWNNAVKYSINNMTIAIEYLVQKEYVVMKVTMVSLQITDEDYENMFEEGYSGYWAKVQSSEGNGIGMYYIKRLMTLNKGKFLIERGKNNFQLNGIPYTTNVFKFEFVKAE